MRCHSVVFGEGRSKCGALVLLPSVAQLGFRRKRTARRGEGEREMEDLDPLSAHGRIVPDYHQDSVLIRSRVNTFSLATSFCFGNDECINAWNIRVYILMVTFLIMIVSIIKIYFKSPVSVITKCLDLRLIPLE